MLDQSNSVGPDNFDIAKIFIKDTVSFFNIGQHESRFGLISFSTREYLEFDLNRHTSLSSLLAGIDSVRYRGGWSAIARGLNAARDLLNPNYPFGARPDLEGIPKIVILITGEKVVIKWLDKDSLSLAHACTAVCVVYSKVTGTYKQLHYLFNPDGHSNVVPLESAVLSLKQSGIQVYVVGVGNKNVHNIKTIASEPFEEYFIEFESFHDTLTVVDRISSRVCESKWPLK